MKKTVLLLAILLLLIGTPVVLAQVDEDYPMYFPLIRKAPAAPTPTPTVTPPPPANLPAFANPGFEAGTANWTQNVSGLITNSAPVDPHGGQWLAWLHKGVRSNITGYWSATISQNVAVPANVNHAYLTIWFYVQSDEWVCEEELGQWADALILTVNGQPAGLLTLCKNQNFGEWRQANLGYDFAQWKGRTVDVRFELYQDNFAWTNLYLDDLGFSPSPPAAGGSFTP